MNCKLRPFPDDDDDEWQDDMDIDGLPYLDDDEEALSECAQVEDTCLRLGEEYCEFDCPFRKNLSRKKKRKKH